MNHKPGLADHWDAETTRFRAEVLAEIHPHLAAALAEDAAYRQRDAFWKEIYLPLVQVHGFLKTSQAIARDAAWPHLAWAEAEPADPLLNRRLARFKDLFRALQTDRWLDADDAVLQLARAHLQIADGDPNPWRIPPHVVFANLWGVNANLRIWKRLLDGQAPPADPAWFHDHLDKVAGKVVAELKTNPPRIGPTFPIAGGVPTADAFQDVGDYATWAASLVAAREGHDDFCYDARGEPEEDGTRVVATGRADEPFCVEVGPTVVERHVDGDLRAALVAVLLQGPTGAPPDRGVERLVRLAEVAMMLPNDPDNLSGLLGSLASFQGRRQEVYAALNGAMARAGGREPRLKLLRAMMCLDVSRRSAGPLQPGFDGVANGVEAAAQGDPALVMGIEDIRAERAELLASLELGSTPDPIGSARRFVDEQIRALKPRNLGGADRAIRNRGWRERLAALDDRRVVRVLKLRNRLRTILDHAAVAEAPADEGTWADLGRIGEMLDLIDYTISYGRPDFFDPGNSGNYLKSATAIDAETEQLRQWWPALVVLAWCDAGLQGQALRAVHEAGAGPRAAAGPGEGPAHRGDPLPGLPAQ